MPSSPSSGAGQPRLDLFKQYPLVFTKKRLVALVITVNLGKNQTALVYLQKTTSPCRATAARTAQLQALPRMQLLPPRTRSDFTTGRLHPLQATLASCPTRSSLSSLPKSKKLSPPFCIISQAEFRAVSKCCRIHPP